MRREFAFYKPSQCLNAQNFQRIVCIPHPSGHGTNGQNFLRIPFIWKKSKSKWLQKKSKSKWLGPSRPSRPSTSVPSVPSVPSVHVRPVRPRPSRPSTSVPSVHVHIRPNLHPPIRRRDYHAVFGINKLGDVIRRQSVFMNL